MDQELKIESAVRVYTRKLLNSEVGEAAWIEIVVEEICQNDVDLMNQFIFNSEIFQSLPSSVIRNLLERISGENQVDLKCKLLAVDGRNADWGGPEVEEITNYLKLSLPVENVRFVNSRENYLSCISCIRESDIIGIDGEWKPSWMRWNTRSKINPVSILQIATRNYCFILDFITLRDQLTVDEWKLLPEVIQDPGRVKIGFALLGDFTRLKDCTGFESIDIAEVENLFDLKVICGRLARTNPSIFGGNSCQDLTLNLSNVVEIFLGQPLDKREQLSNWERRPLRSSQFIYAALDAFVLIPLFDQISHICSKQNITFPPPPIPVVEQQLELDIASFPVVNIDKAVDCTEIAFICDQHLKGLCKRLRNVGISAEHVDSTWTEQQIFSAVYLDERYFLTSASRLPSAKKRFPREFCFAVPNCLKSVRQLEYIKKMFNITLTKENVLSRCSGCNSGDFIQASYEELRRILDVTSPEVGSGDAGVPDKFRITSPLAEIETKRSFAVSFKNIEAAADAVDFQTGKIKKSNVKIEGSVVQTHKIGRVKEYFICQHCGKVFWQGSHFRRNFSFLTLNNIF